MRQQKFEAALNNIVEEVTNVMEDVIELAKLDSPVPPTKEDAAIAFTMLSRAMERVGVLAEEALRRD